MNKCFLFLLALAVFDCSGSGGGKVCEPGSQKECTCTGDDTGHQTCLDDGSDWGSCQCPCVMDCENRECGPDPVCGESCGQCGSDETCTASGKCSAVCDPPLADAGADQNILIPIAAPANVVLDGSGSHPSTTCDNVTIIGYSWSVVSQPAGSNISISDAEKAVATTELAEFGDYVFRLQVQDSGGTDNGRLDTNSDTVAITLDLLLPCDVGLTVKAISAGTRQALAGARVIVVDADGDSHTQYTSVSGEAVFDDLAVGTRKSITIISDDKVPAMPGVPPGERPKYETTTLLNNCSNQVTIPIEMTASGQAAGGTGIITAKIPQSIFNMLPHSYKCAGNCSVDIDCEPHQYCEQEPNECQGLCTPKSLLPFFSMGGGDISGQMRAAIITPMFAGGNFSSFPAGRIFALPPGDSAILPGNVASDDTFLNGLAPTMGIDPYGINCNSINDCPNEPGCDTPDCPDLRWTCDYYEHRCKDPTPLSNIRMGVPAGNNVRMVLVSGIVDISMMDFLSVMLQLFSPSGGGVQFEDGSVLAAFNLHTLHVCPLSVNVTAGQENDISPALAAITAGDCWNVDYQQTEDVVPLRDPAAVNPANSCTSDQECENQNPGYKCLADPDNPGNSYCFMPLYRVKIISNDETTLQQASDGFDPTAADGDLRLRALLPASAQFEVMCDANGDGVPEPCDPQVLCDIPISPDTTDCAFSYGLALAALDFPPGNQSIPEGGRAIIGFDFNRTPSFCRRESKFLVPSLDSPALAGASLNMTQVFLRDMIHGYDTSYELIPGRLGSSATSTSSVATLQMPALPTPPAHDALPDAGLEIVVHFTPLHPLADCASVSFTNIYALARQVLAPQAGSHELPDSMSESNLSGDAVRGLVLSKTDRLSVGVKEHVLADAWWRIYAPKGTTTFELPAAANPFTSGTEVRVTFWGSEFTVPFDYDLFPVDQLLSGQSAEVQDSWQLLVP